MQIKQREFAMHECFNTLSKNLNLTSYQTNKLKLHYDKYNIARLQKRGGLLYAPYVVHGFFGKISNILLGARADLIGQNKTLLRAQRNIKFGANGYHCVKVGRYTYYADSMGDVISREEFLENKNL